MMIMMTMREIHTSLSAYATIISQSTDIRMLVSITAASIASGTITGLLRLNDNNVFIAYDLYKKSAFFLIALKSIVFGIMIKFETNYYANYAHETFAAIDEHGNYDVDILVLFLKCFA